MSKVGVKVLVTGHVQCVGFRYHTAHEGLKLDLTGFAKNLVDGRVEVQAFGDVAQIEILVKWLEEGPITARVDNIDIESIEWLHYKSFTIK
ncbi:acylphosphatase [Vibrio sp. SS-MA-C1-2]|uniref:acylphosphatase n=1 Tax=Vibrio sp. SS-MA-C1-2 TaxID=2908646 RepID=UPI001F3C2B02|nr:acylphosphatase [Vibrio sp. SS-MA-C1-2]UJF20015.1 acylphosphatase [Vibrio sp. SS-MA-C1-2]